jgi:quercetin dioxygenase-like cupin family protein
MAGREQRRTEARRAIASAGAAPEEWSNGPDEAYAAHAHDYRKLLFCTVGSITFHLPDGDVVLVAGDCLDLPLGTMHGATVGPEGVTCVEGAIE